MTQDDALTDQQFRLIADAAIESLEQRLLPLADEHNFEVEQQGSVLQVIFEEPRAERFIVSPNAPVRQIWVSAMARGYKLPWSASANTFALESETLEAMMKRLVSEFLYA